MNLLTWKTKEKPCAVTSDPDMTVEWVTTSYWLGLLQCFEDHNVNKYKLLHHIGMRVLKTATLNKSQHFLKGKV